MFTKVDTDAGIRRRVLKGAYGLMALALVFYFGFIAISIYRSRH
jgi:hypothetical protein